MDHLQPSFIGRLSQIQIFEDLVLYEGEKRWILNIYGSGGIGKTALLRYYQSLCDQHGAPYGPLIDFYELEYHSPRRVMRDMARALAMRRPEYFAPFLEATAREPGLQAEASEKYLKDATRLFKAGLAQLALENVTTRNVKTVLLFDTCEQAPRSLGNWLTQELLCNIPHVIAVVAGRDAVPIPHGRQDEFYPCALDTFTLDEAKHFFAIYQPPVQIDERQIADLWSLAHGMPILLALTADWLSHNVSPEELSRISSDQFARSLVQRFASLGELANAAVLYMGHLYHRFNAEIFCKAHLGNELDMPTAHKTLEDLRSFQFIKYRASGNYQLHDHARRLVCDYLLSNQEGTALRLRLSRNILASYYPSLLDQKRIAPDPVWQAERLYHELFIDAHYLQYHAMFPNDPRDDQYGYRLFEEAFDAAINRNDKIEVCDLLLSIVEHEDFEGVFANRPSTAIKRARLWLRDPARREEACESLNNVLDTPGLSPIQRIEALLSLSRFTLPDVARVYQEQARLEIQRMVDVQPARPAATAAPPTDSEATLSVEQAAPELPSVSIAQRAHALQLLAYLETNLGLTYRRQGHWNKAIEHYQRALDALSDLPTDTQKRRQMAAVHNNLAFIHRQRGDLHKAEIFCRLSLATREELGETGQMAFSYHTLGEIYMDMGRHTEARHYMLKSLASFRQVGDMRNAGMVFVDLSTLARWRGAPDLADYYYTQAINLFRAWEVPEGTIDAANEHACELHRRGLEQLEIEDTDLAMEFYQQAEILLRESLQRLSGSDRHYRMAYTRSKLCEVLQSQAKLLDNAAERELLATEMLAMADQIEDYASRNNYALFSSNADIIRGQIAFQRAIGLRGQSAKDEPASAEQISRHLEVAFRHFANACAKLAEFYLSPSEKFRRSFDHVVEHLLHPFLTPGQVDMACSTIIYHFEREGKDRISAAFVENCRRIRQARGTGSDRETP